jgi:asparaginyl-tRNA synthetase
MTQLRVALPIRTTSLPQPPPGPREHLSSPVTSSVLRIQHRILIATREFLCQQGFTELLLPILGPVTDPGARGAKQVDVDYYGHRYKLMTSAILYKQASLTMFDKIFCIAPNVRLEPLDTTVTSRHLAEFHQIDVEMAGAGRDQIMQLAEDLLGSVLARVMAELPAELERLGRDSAALAELSAGPFGRRTHSDAVAVLHAQGHAQNPDAEIDWEGEAILSERASRPFFLTDYPKGSRGFYDRESKERPGYLRNFDLIAGEGYGELCSGSEREHDYATIIARMRETGENPAKYGWYLTMVREGIPASAGFGIGVERLTRYLAGLDAVWQASAFPKIPGVVSP